MFTDMVSQGASRIHFESLRKQIIKCLALVEAIIDFSEGEDLEDGILDDGKLVYIEYVC